MRAGKPKRAGWVGLVTSMWGVFFLRCGDAGEPGSVLEAGGAESMGGSAGGEGENLGGGSWGDEQKETPRLLSETGLFGADRRLSPGVRSYAPRFELWSDGAAKQRWIWLPPGTTIDTSDPDYWSYPVGTKVWKSFSLGGQVLETRLLEKLPDGGWEMIAFAWPEGEDDAVAAPEGRENWLGAQHDIPSAQECVTCHSKMPDKVLGFSAIQLMSSEQEFGGLGGAGGDAAARTWTAELLELEGRLSHQLPAAVLPGTPEDQAVLGWLHANCGNCHNSRSSVTGRVDWLAWLEVDSLESLEESNPYRTGVGVPAALAEGPEAGEWLFAPGAPDRSDVFLRAGLRSSGAAMPPLGTEKTDEVAMAALEAWILGLP